jgi:hypothetical protein
MGGWSKKRYKYNGFFHIMEKLEIVTYFAKYETQD